MLYSPGIAAAGYLVICLHVHGLLTCDLALKITIRIFTKCVCDLKLRQCLWIAESSGFQSSL